MSLHNLKVFIGDKEELWEEIAPLLEENKVITILRISGTYTWYIEIFDEDDLSDK